MRWLSDWNYISQLDDDFRYFVGDLCACFQGVGNGLDLASLILKVSGSLLEVRDGLCDLPAVLKVLQAEKGKVVQSVVKAVYIILDIGGCISVTGLTKESRTSGGRYDPPGSAGFNVLKAVSAATFRTTMFLCRAASWARLPGLFKDCRRASWVDRIPAKA